MFKTIKDLWTRFLMWCDDSETILLARAEMLGGFFLTVISSLDWSPLLAMGINTGFSWQQGVAIGSIMMLRGVIQEWLRRRRATDLPK